MKRTLLLLAFLLAFTYGATGMNHAYLLVLIGFFWGGWYGIHRRSLHCHSDNGASPFCVKCGGHFAAHNDDGSCVEDDVKVSVL